MSAPASPTSSPEVPPRVEGYPLLGCVPHLMKDPLNFLAETQRKHGDIFNLSLGFAEATVLCHARHAQHVLVDHSRKYSKSGPMWDSVRSVMGNGLPTSEGALWKRQRAMVQPAFHRQVLGRLTDQIIQAINESMDAWQEAALAQKPFEISQALDRMSMTILVRTVFGSALSHEEKEELCQAFAYIVKYLTVNMMTNGVPKWVPVPGRSRYRECIKVVEDGMQRLIERASNESLADDNLLGLLLRAVDGESGERMSHAQLRDETIAFVFAGFETTAKGLVWAFHRVASHPEIAARMLEEVEQVTGDGHSLGLQELMKLSFTRNVWQESLRVHSPSVWLPRQAVEDDEIDGYRIPAGRTVALLSHLIHHHPDLWPEPMTFDPDRWTPARSEGRHRHAMMAFGTGQRQCLAKELALMEGTLIFARMLPRFVFTSVPGREPQPQVGANLGTKNGMWLNVMPRSSLAQRPQQSVARSA